MKVAYYETRQNSKHFTCLKHFNPMHSCGVIICMNLKGFSEKLQSLDKWANRRTKKTCHGPKLAGPEVHRGGAGGAAHIGPTGRRGSRVVGRRIWAAETQCQDPDPKSHQSSM